MNELARNCSLVFAAGCIGGLANSLLVWGFGRTGISDLMRVAIKPTWTPAWLYPRLIWGGLWGFLFLLPYMTDSIVLRGLIFSLGPTLVVSLIVFPYQAHKGMFGLELGTLTPVFAFIVNAGWGIAAAWWLQAISY